MSNNVFQTFPGLDTVAPRVHFLGQLNMGRIVKEQGWLHKQGTCMFNKSMAVIKASWVE
eukprot:Pgem_evm1s7865